MAIRIEYREKPTSHFLEIVVGKVTKEDFLRAVDERIKHSLHQKGLHTITDINEADLSLITGDDLQEISEYITQRIEFLGKGWKNAVVGEASVQFGIGRMYDAHSDNKPYITRTFRNLDEAEEWIFE